MCVCVCVRARTYIRMYIYIYTFGWRCGEDVAPVIAEGGEGLDTYPPPSNAPAPDADADGCTWHAPPRCTCLAPPPPSHMTPSSSSPPSSISLSACLCGSVRACVYARVYGKG